MLVVTMDYHGCAMVYQQCSANATPLKCIDILGRKRVQLTEVENSFNHGKATSCYLLPEF